MSRHNSKEIRDSSIDAIIEIYKKDIDLTLIRQNLKLTVEQRLLNLENFMQFANELREAGKKMHKAASIKK